MASSRINNVLKNSGANLIYRASHILLQFVLRTAFIYILGKEYTGISSLFTDILQVLSLLELGMGSAMLYSLYKPLAEHDVEKISALMNFYKKTYTVIGCMVFVVGLSIAPFLDYLVKGVPNIKESILDIYLIYVVTSASSYFLVYKTCILRANQESRIISLADSVLAVAEGICEVVALLLFREFFAYLILRFLFTLGRNIIISNIAQKRHPEYWGNKKARLPKEEVSKMYKDIFALGLYKVSGVVVNNSSSIVISAFIGTQEIAVLGNFTLIINSVRSVIQQVVDATKASIGNLVVTSSKEKQKEVFDQMNFIAFWASCFICTCFYVLLNPFVGEVWFSESFKVSQDIVTLLTVNFFIAVMVFPVESFRLGNGLFVQGKYRPAIMAVLNVVLAIVFVQYWGIAGVLFATTVSRLLTQVWFDPYLVFSRAFNCSVLPFYLEYILQAAVTALCCITAAYLAEAVYISNVYLRFVYMAFVAAVVPNVILFVLFRKNKSFVGIKKVAKRFLKR